MSKCKAVLDSDKITEIRVKVKKKTPDNQSLDKLEQKNSKKSQPITSRTIQQSK